MTGRAHSLGADLIKKCHVGVLTLPPLSLRPDLAIALPRVVPLLAASALFPFLVGAMRTREEILGWMSEDRSSCAPTQVSANL